MFRVDTLFLSQSFHITSQPNIGKIIRLHQVQLLLHVDLGQSHQHVHEVGVVVGLATGLLGSELVSEIAVEQQHDLLLRLVDVAGLGRGERVRTLRGQREDVGHDQEAGQELVGPHVVSNLKIQVLHKNYQPKLS